MKLVIKILGAVDQISHHTIVRQSVFHIDLTIALVQILGNLRIAKVRRKTALQLVPFCMARRMGQNHLTLCDWIIHAQHRSSSRGHRRIVPDRYRL